MNYEEMIAYIVKKTNENVAKVGDRLPEATVNGKFIYKENCGWTGGFWVGLLNYCYLFSGDPVYLEYAERSRHRFLNRLYNSPETLDHDLGFLFIPTEYARYRLQKKEESRQVVIDAANALKARYNEKGRFIQAWNVWAPGEEFSENNRGRIIIDCLYNLPLLFIAGELTGDASYAEVACAHVDTCMDSILREDGTTFHTFVFDPVTGEKRFGQTCQGYADDSCWARGQAWALGGFAKAYAWTKTPAYLDCAKKTAEVFWSSLEEDHIPKWDFAFKGREDVAVDASAAAIAACGMLEIARLCRGEEKERYYQRSKAIVKGLWEECTSRYDSRFDGIIKHCVGGMVWGSYVNENLIYADYYFAQAIYHLKKFEESQEGEG